MTVKNEIYKWLTQTVIELNLCPFAKGPLDAGQINIQISKAQSFEIAYQDFVKQLDLLLTCKNFKTSLLVFPKLNASFEMFNDFSGSLEETLVDSCVDDFFQTVCFHPDFRFFKLDAWDKANYVNRSPYPLIHILLKEDVKKAMSSMQAAKKISYINEKKIKSLSAEELKKKFWFL